MEEYRLQINTNESDNFSILLQEYWEIVNEEFINKPNQLCEKYNLTVGELNKIVKTNSRYTIIQGFCDRCKTVIEEIAYSQTSFKEKKKQNKKKLCIKCESIILKEHEEARLKIVQEEKRQIEEQFNEAIQNKKWKELSDEEIQILKDIIRIKKKSTIYKEIFKNNPFDKSIWRKVGNIEKTGLLLVKRTESKSVISFVFPKNLESILIENDSSDLDEIQDVLSFSLSKNINKTSLKQPEYSGTFVLKRPVILDPDIKYSYGGWINTDGSISLTIKPFPNDYLKADDGKIERNPIHIRNLLEDFIIQMNEKVSE